MLVVEVEQIREVRTQKRQIVHLATRWYIGKRRWLADIPIDLTLQH